ncbi:MAG TPA: hypothetical protein VEK07_02630 [Polyangiaceae bacterium]|nr:hypothetical protein [Polyangiaceae bacterium]
MTAAFGSLRAVLRWLACAYLAGVWLDGAGSTLPASVLPRAINYFLQVAALFPSAAVASIDYRAEGWVCAGQRWEELDTRPYFPIEPDDKENRFQRVMHFYRQDRRTMHALDAYLVERHREGRHDDGIADRAIGGVRLSSLRIPIPRPGDSLERPRRRSLAEYPEDEKHVFYHTPRSKLAERCGTQDVGAGGVGGD